MEYDGYSLFDDVDIKDIRVFNQGVILANILEDNMVDGSFSEEGVFKAKQYLKRISEQDRADCLENAIITLIERETIDDMSVLL